MWSWVGSFKSGDAVFQLGDCTGVRERLDGVDELPAKVHRHVTGGYGSEDGFDLLYGAGCGVEVELHGLSLGLERWRAPR
ncbi:MAG: hypothetical protein KGL48_09995 [Sphingomonadales bacterium]|nr:hypothetical protein [Sphingomonadales bacterium]